jgi:hypothetical protein
MASRSCPATSLVSFTTSVKNPTTPPTSAAISPRELPDHEPRPREFISKAPPHAMSENIRQRQPTKGAQGATEVMSSRVAHGRKISPELGDCWESERTSERRSMRGNRSRKGNRINSRTGRHPDLVEITIKGSETEVEMQSDRWTKAG